MDLINNPFPYICEVPPGSVKYYSILFYNTVAAHSNGKMNNLTSGKPGPPSRFPCAACKINRRKCSERCLLAPYFPADDPEKFLCIHRVFGHGHAIKLLQDLPTEQRGEAVSSMVYEARARLRYPVHGCVGVINDLKRQIAEIQSQLDSTKAELQSQLASTRAELADMSEKHAHLLTLIKRNHEGSGC